MTPTSLPSAISASVPHERKTVRGTAGLLSYYVRGEGQPLLLLHSINAAGSAYEMKPIFEKLEGPFRIYAVDLPGFGLSDRSNRDYSVELYVSAIRDMLDVIARDCGPAPVHVAALSLACEFLARAAIRWPDRFGKLAFITPTGFDKRSANARGAPGSTRQVSGVLPTLSVSFVGDAVFGALTTESSIRFFLRKTFGSDRFDEDLLRYDYATTHQPGAKYAPIAFVSGKLFSADIRNVYEQLRHPVWMAYATRGDFADFSGVGWVKGRGNWRAEPWPAGAMIHFEYPEKFNAALREFLAPAGNADQLHTAETAAAGAGNPAR